MISLPWLRARQLRRARSRRLSPKCVRDLAAFERLEERTLLTAYVVDTLSDVVGLDGKISLREAIEASNTNAVVADAAAGQGGGAADTITFDASLAGGTIGLGGRRLEVRDHLNLTGLGAKHLTLSGLNASQILYVGDTATVEISGFRFTAGSALSNTLDSDGGGAIFNDGALTLVDSAFVGNRAVFGGAVLNNGLLSVTGSTFSANQADYGGGLYNLHAADLDLANVTLSGNSARVHGGGIFNTVGGATTLSNVTLYGNRADSDGNGVGSGGGVYAYQYDTGTNRALLRNTIIAGNVRGSGTGTANDLFVTLDGAANNGAVTAGSKNNFVGNAAAAGGLINGVAGNIIGGNVDRTIDPVLRDNGGPTFTHALLPEGVAIDGGDDASAVDANGDPLAFDQRGDDFPRVFGESVDIGAYESQVPSPVDDLVGFYAGGWWVGVSDGSGFDTAAWAGWDPTGWQKLAHGDFNGDGRSDVLGFRSGEWWVGLSTGSGYITSRWGGWAVVVWKDILVGDINGDGRDDVVARHAQHWWGALSTGTGFASPTRVAAFDFDDYTDATLADMTGDDRADLVRRIGGDNYSSWYVGVSNGSSFTTVSWPGDAEWFYKPHLQDVRFADFNGDGKMDFTARETSGTWNGQWLVSLSTGTAFSTSVWATWVPLNWIDIRTGDFNGDGRDDLAGRLAGEWWVGVSDGTKFVTTRWDTWADATWQDVVTGDFNGDRRDDIAGRLGGNWWVSLSDGPTFVHAAYWGTWSNVAWQAVAAAEANPSEESGMGGGALLAASAEASKSLPFHFPAAGPAMSKQEEPLVSFWSQSDEDDEFTAFLAAG